MKYRSSQDHTMVQFNWGELGARASDKLLKDWFTVHQWYMDESWRDH